MKSDSNTIYFVDGISQVIFAPFNSIFFYFAIIMIVVHKNNIRTNSIKILISHFVLKSLGDSIDRIRSLILNDDDRIYTSSSLWYIRLVAFVFWVSGDVVGDLYLISRTTPILFPPYKRKQLIFSYISYILLALSKLSVVVYHFLFPYQKIVESGSEYYNKYWDNYWNIQLITGLLTVIYDIVIYFTMKVDFFDKNIYSEIEENKTWKNYRKMSRLRVKYIAIMSSILFFVIISYKINIIKTHLKASFLEYYLSLLMTMAYVMMYIDQILISETDLIPINESIVHMNIYSYH